MMTNDAYDRYRLILIMIQALEVELGAGIEKHTTWQARKF